MSISFPNQAIGGLVLSSSPLFHFFCHIFLIYERFYVVLLSRLEREVVLSKD